MHARSHSESIELRPRWHVGLQVFSWPGNRRPLLASRMISNKAVSSYPCGKLYPLYHPLQSSSNPSALFPPFPQQPSIGVQAPFWKIWFLSFAFALLGIWVSPAWALLLHWAFSFALHVSVFLPALVDAMAEDAAVMAVALEASFASFLPGSLFPPFPALFPMKHNQSSLV